MSGALNEQHLASARLVHRMIPNWFRHRAAMINDHAPLHATSRNREQTGCWLIGLGCPLAIVVAVAVGNGATIAVGKNPLRPDRVLTKPCKVTPTIMSKDWLGSGS